METNDQGEVKKHNQSYDAINFEGGENNKNNPK